MCPLIQSAHTSIQTVGRNSSKTRSVLRLPNGRASIRTRQEGTILWDNRSPSLYSNQHEAKRRTLEKRNETLLTSQTKRATSWIGQQSKSVKWVKNNQKIDSKQSLIFSSFSKVQYQIFLFWNYLDKQTDFWTQTWFRKQLLIQLLLFCWCVERPKMILFLAAPYFHMEKQKTLTILILTSQVSNKCFWTKSQVIIYLSL